MKKLLLLIFLAAVGTGTAASESRRAACSSVGLFAKTVAEGRQAGASLSRMMELHRNPDYTEGMSSKEREAFININDAILEVVYSYPMIIGSDPIFKESQETAATALQDKIMLWCLRSKK